MFVRGEMFQTVLMTILLLVVINLQHSQNKIIAKFKNQCAICIDAFEYLDNLYVIFDKKV